MAGEADLEAAGFREHHVTARTLNVAHPEDTRQLGPFCRLEVAEAHEVPLRPGVYAWVTSALDERVRRALAAVPVPNKLIAAVVEELSSP